MPLNVPNLLTLMRVLLVPVVIYFYLNEQIVTSLVFFLIATTSDFFDGYLARRLGQTTNFGAIFDPIADKFVALGFYGLIGYLGLAPWWLIFIVWTRNFSQLMSVPILIWWLKREFFVKPKPFAKWSTAFSDIYIVIPLFSPLIAGLGLSIPSNAMTVVAVLLSLSEAYILVTYLPRLYLIAIEKHDTFE